MKLKAIISWNITFLLMTRTLKVKISEETVLMTQIKKIYNTLIFDTYLLWLPARGFKLAAAVHRDVKTSLQLAMRKWQVEMEEGNKVSLTKELRNLQARGTQMSVCQSNSCHVLLKHLRQSSGQLGHIAVSVSLCFVKYSIRLSEDFKATGPLDIFINSFHITTTTAPERIEIVFRWQKSKLAASESKNYIREHK